MAGSRDGRKCDETTLATCNLRQKPEITEFGYVDIEKAELEAFADYVKKGASFRTNK